MTLLHQAAQKAVEALRQVTTSETFYRDPRGDRAGPAIDALVSALQQQPEPVAADRDLHSHMMVVATRAAEGRAGKLVLREVCRAIAADKNLRAKLTAPPALQHQEVPREPVARPSMSMYASAADYSAAMDGWIATTRQCPACKGKFGVDGQACDLCNATGRVPSTTRQQEVGSGWKLVPVVPTRAMHDVMLTWGTKRSEWEALLAAAPSTPEKAGGVPARLWAMHIAGPDDVHAAPGEAEARAAAERFNEWFAQRKDPHPLDPQMHATAIEWPHSAEAHANDLPRWRDFVLPAAGVEGKCECGLSEVACRDPLRRSCPDGMSASVSHPLPAQANDGGEHV